MQITPLSRQNLIRIWAGLLPFLVAMPVTIGSSISLGSSSLTLKRRKKKRKKIKDESNLIHKTFKGWGNHNTSLKTYWASFNFQAFDDFYGWQNPKPEKLPIELFSICLLISLNYAWPNCFYPWF